MTVNPLNLHWEIKGNFLVELQLRCISQLSYVLWKSGSEFTKWNAFHGGELILKKDTQKKSGLDLTLSKEV